MTLYEFHKASIHERRFAAKLCAAAPLLILLGYFALLGYGVTYRPSLLLLVCAVMNTATWYWLASTLILGIVGAMFTKEALERAKIRQPRVFAKEGAGQGELADSVCIDTVDRVVHMIVLPNYKEDQCMLAETLESLAEADESHSFCIVLGMEEREAGSAQKGEWLKQRFKKSFAGITVVMHPSTLIQTHLDGSSDPEVPGKASNLKWAVPHGFEDFVREGVIESKSSVMLTVADADCIFHPGYFAAVSREFNTLRDNSSKDHMWTMYQAPQLPFRNFFSAVAPCRIWAYVSSAFEFGGVTGLSYGMGHMTFSGYSLPLQLGLDAGAWDGDVIAEDHHNFLKCFFYSALESAKLSETAVVPKLKVHPIYLPVKATSVQGEEWLSTCLNRWCQAKRHAQGVSELSYAMLATWDAMCTLPWTAQSFAFYSQAFANIARLFNMHLLTTCQGASMLVFSLYWIYNGGFFPKCSHHFHLAYLTAPQDLTLKANVHHLVCGLGGAWMLYVPTIVMTLLVITANFLFLRIIFLKSYASKTAHAESIWHAQDSGVPRGRAGAATNLLVFLQVCIDCFLLLTAVMVPYGFFPNVAAYIDCAIHGNRVKYIAALKPVSSYGTQKQLLAKSRIDYAACLDEKKPCFEAASL